MQEKKRIVGGTSREALISNSLQRGWKFRHVVGYSSVICYRVGFLEFRRVISSESVCTRWDRIARLIKSGISTRAAGTRSDAFRAFLCHGCFPFNGRQRQALARGVLIIQSKALLKQIRRRAIVEPARVRARWKREMLHIALTRAGN